MSADVAPGRPGGTTFRVKPAPWQWAVAGLILFLSYAIGIFFEYLSLSRDPILTHDGTPITGADRWWLIALTSIGFFVLPWAGPLAIGRTSRFSILEDGIRLNRADGKLTPWDQVESCRWNPHPPAGTLMIQIPHSPASLSIPERNRAEVEATLRRFGKWRD